MKKILFGLSLFLVVAFAARAQDCATGYCPETLTVDHNAGEISPLTVNITYGVVESTLSGATACWITQNLGATAQASSATDASVAARGWFWQFNRKQGYAHDGTTRTPSVVNWITAIDENSDWLAENDPCTLLLGGNWHIPTTTEYGNVVTNGAWTEHTDAYNSVLKIHAAGYASSGILGEEGVTGLYWSSKQDATNKGYVLYIKTSIANPAAVSYKTSAYSVRCIRTY